ncbi:DHA2 family efflux MFS transporter permease subunit [Stomatohabitans albus]|uniref:DHA2 family efflux MFS transporter permease subunit n=1 Tax=Stomatohabitans albus TaxID=3110766 RepID=UPI00300C2700
MTSTHPSRWWALAVLAAGLSMIVLDGTIVGVALPAIIRDLHLTLSDAQWLNAIYSVVFAALLMSFGRMADLYGRRNMFIGGVMVFVAGSIWAATAQHGNTMLLARGLQGVGGAMVLPTSLSSVNTMFQGNDRATAFGIWGAVMAGMAAIGPLLGGWLTATLSWRWIFWVNLPIGLLVVIGALLVAPNSKAADAEPGRFDWLGLVLSIVGFGALVFAVIEGPELGWIHPIRELTVGNATWSRSAPVSLAFLALVVGIVGIGVFITWERHRLHQRQRVLLNLALFSIPTFSWGNITAMAVAVGEFALVFVLPLYLIGVLGLSPFIAGWVLAAMALGAFVAGALARHASARFGAARVVLIGLILEVIGVGVLALVLNRSVSPFLVSACLIIYGVGLGFAAAQLTSTVLADIPPTQSGQGSATQSTVRQVGSALGIALSGSALAAGFDRYLTHAFDGMTAIDPSQAQALIDATRSSVGSNLAGLRADVANGLLGAQGNDIVNALATAFTGATRWSLVTAMVFLALGMVGAVRVVRAAHPTTPATG